MIARQAMGEPQAMPGVPHRYVQAGGLRVHVAEAGQGPPLVLQHGWPQLDDLHTLPDAERLDEEFDDLALDDRRRLLALGIDCVFVRRRSGREPLADRVHICWRGTAPDLPARGRRDYTPRPFLFDRPEDIGAAAA
jgi:pimeloyl-ACP methyl ester carboxylesterase